MEKEKPTREIGINSYGNLFLSSEEISYEKTLVKELEIGDKKIFVEALSRKGSSYLGDKKVTEDGCIAINNDSDLQAIVVDGGTQIEKVSTIDELDMTGGRYITTMVEKFGRGLNPSLSVAVNLKLMNTNIGSEIATDHPSVTYQEHDYHTPYASVAGVKVDTINNTLEAANAGDVFVIAVDYDNNSKLLTVDDVYRKDQETFATTRRLADEHKVSFREVMQQRTNDPRFFGVVEETRETLRQGNLGIIRRVTGNPNFDVTSNVIVPLSDIRSVYIFTDGGILPGKDINTTEAQIDFIRTIDEAGLEGLNKKIKEELASDPEYEKYPRFGDIDDMMMLKISMSDLKK